MEGNAEPLTSPESGILPKIPPFWRDRASENQPAWNPDRNPDKTSRFSDHCGWKSRIATLFDSMRTIKDLPEHSRPREKLQERGASALTDEELVAAILGMGTAGIDVRTMAKQVAGLIREHREALTVDHLRSVPGMGLAKAAQILSAFELARRHLVKDGVKINCAKDVLPLVSDIAGKQQEYFLCISLNGANEVIEKRVVTIASWTKARFTRVRSLPMSSPTGPPPSFLPTTTPPASSNRAKPTYACTTS